MEYINAAISQDTLTSLCDEFRKNNRIEPEKFEKYQVKRGLRNEDGSGVMAGLTLICNVHGYVINEGERSPEEGRLTYRGVDIRDLVSGCIAEDRFGYEETAWLLLFGRLPTKEQLDRYCQLLSDCREMPGYFGEDMIVKAPSPNIMNKLARSVLAMYSYDQNPDDISMENVLRQSVQLMAMLPTMMACAYQVKRHHYDRESMFFHPVKPGSVHCGNDPVQYPRGFRLYPRGGPALLDLCLMLHAEHGGGNNSTFAAGCCPLPALTPIRPWPRPIGSLKGPRHGGANIKVMEMLDYIKEGVRDWEDDEEICRFLEKLILREAGDRSGLIYGMGHAVYTLSDPRAVILKKYAYDLAEKKGFGGEFRLLEAVERLTPGVFAKVKGNDKAMCANVDLYSGMVYRSLGIDKDLYTPLFAVARMAGWSAHRIEEILTGGRIIRPAYKAVARPLPYVPLADR